MVCGVRKETRSALGRPEPLANVALLTISESAIASGFSIELLEALMKRCPKRGEDPVLDGKVMDDTIYIDDRELQSYLVYLRKPWRPPASGKTLSDPGRDRARRSS